MRRIALLGVGVAVALIALGVGACGGGSDSTTTAASSSTTTTEASSSTTSAAEDTSGNTTNFLGASLTAATAGEPGVVVLRVAPDSLSRLHRGDVIIACNRKPVATPDELIACAGKLEIGGEFRIRVVRGSERFTLAEVQVPTAFLGTGVKDASGGERGAVVVRVAPGSPAEEAGIKPGDVITAVDDAPVRSGDDLVEAVGTHTPGDEVTVTAVRDSKEVQFSVTLVRNPGAGG